MKKVFTFGLFAGPFFFILGTIATPGHEPGFSQATVSFVEALIDASLCFASVGALMFPFFMDETYERFRLYLALVLVTCAELCSTEIMQKNILLHDIHIVLLAVQTILLILVLKPGWHQALARRYSTL